MFTLSLNPELFHFFGPFSVHVYGVFVGIAVAVFIACTLNSPMRKKYIVTALYEQLMLYTIIVALCGARLLHVVSEWHTYQNITQMFEVWNGGLSILGALLAGLVFVPLFLRYHRVAVLPVLDVAAIYIPLMQAIARLGCLFSGCCFGCATTGLSIMYTHPGSHAPLHTALHPTQLYSSIFFFMLFGVLYIRSWYRPRIGELTALYLIFSSIERFGIDFLRGDRIIDTTNSLIYTSTLSLHQWISIAIMIIGIILLIRTYGFDSATLRSPRARSKHRSP